MTNENLISEFVNLWHKLNESNLDIEITFDDGVIHKISEETEIVWNHNDICTCWNP